MTDSFGDIAGAEHLAGIYGTEKDKVNCPFYWKIGACRHGDKCSRTHNKPAFSQTLLIPHMYPNPIATPFVDTKGNQLEYNPQFLKEHFEEFYEDIYDEMAKYGRIEELNVCDNIAEHMLGNVYVKYHNEEEALNALQAMKGRFYAGRVLTPEFSPVTDFREARCRQFEMNECGRGGNCNFMHLRRVNPDLGYMLFGDRFRTLRYHDAKGGGGGREGGRDRSSHRSSRRDYDYDDRSSRSNRREPDDGYRSGRSYRSSRSSPYRSSSHRSSHRTRYSNSPEARTPPSSYHHGHHSSSGQKRKREEDDAHMMNDGFGSAKKMRQTDSMHDHQY
jgi:splicing factor U2AF subunit